MDFRCGWRAVAPGLALAGCGVTGSEAWREGFWALLTGTVFVTVWLTVSIWRNAMLRPFSLGTPALSVINDEAAENHAAMQRLLLDVVPIPMIAIEGKAARALNRAAREVFAADERIVSPPGELLDPAATHFFHEGRNWRIHRVDAPSPSRGMAVAALIDIEREERAAEARASAELIEVLGHELLNGLAPIVSLAESAQSAVSEPPVDAALLEEILGPLARRAEGLQRFAQGYRSLARLPEPTVLTVPLDEFSGDLAKSFADRWPDIDLEVFVPDGLKWPMDRAQMSQAVWALLQNAAEAVVGTDQSKVGIAVACNREQLDISVSDNGNGIPPRNTALIFRPFHTTKPEGSGIGLSLARQIVRAHGGILELTSTKPTVFHLSLPTQVRDVFRKGSS